MCSLILLLTNHCAGFLADINRVATDINVKGIFGRILSFLLGNDHLGVEALGRRTIVCLILLETVRTFYQLVDHFTFPPTMYKGSSSSTFWSTDGVLVS